MCGSRLGTAAHAIRGQFNGKKGRGDARLKKRFCVFLASLLLLCLCVPLEAVTNADLICSYIGIDLLADRNGDLELNPTSTKNWNAAHGSW